MHGLPGRLVRFALCVALVAASTAAWAQGAPTLLRDINAAGSSAPASFATLGDVVLFSASTAAEGRELWRTDGTAAGTALVADIVPGTSGSAPTALTSIGARVVFFAAAGLWVTDGTAAGTQRLAASTGETLSQMRFLTAVGAQAYFTATTSRGNDLWVTDGTTAGTRIVRDLGIAMVFGELLVANGRLYLTYRDPNDRIEVWTTDGSSAGTVRVASLSAPVNHLTMQFVATTMGSRVVILRASRLSGIFGLTHEEYDIWVTEVGNPSVRFVVGGSDGGIPELVIAANASTAYFTKPGLGGGMELGRTDGTAAGTTLVREIRAGGDSSNPRSFVLAGERLYFEADDGTHGRELWTSDGTTEGTQLVADILPGGDGSPLAGFALPWQGELLFDADDGSGRTLWITDGTEAGTRRLGAPPVALDPTNPGIAGGRVVFAATGSGAGTELWALSCGDGALDADEVCDDGNAASDDCCSPLCRPVNAGAACAGLGCSDGVCDTGGTCVLTPRLAGTECRPAAGACDLAEQCDGSSPACPADARAAGTVCRAAAGDCDAAELCDGIAADCPADVKRIDVCRAAAGDCDVAESCDGVADACPADVLAVGDTCRAAAGPCDVAEACDGSGPACPADGFQIGSLCRAATGDCDVAETCDGTSAACPVDAFQTGGTCRAAAGDCDVAETCDGTSAACPADAFQTATHVCRPGDGVCDPSESCSGSDTQCPADVLEDDGDADAVCNLIDNCPEAPNPDQLDGDSDGAGDACDVCTGVAQMSKPSLMLSKLLAPTGDDGLKLVGRMVVPGTPAFDPLVHGVRLVVTDGAGGVVVDAPIPGGAWATASKVGWTVNAAGTTWRYKHAGAPATVVGGIQAMTVKRSSGDPTTVRFTVKGGAGGYPDAAAHLPLRAMLVVEGALGMHGQCAEAAFAASTCRSLSGGKTVRCR